MTNSLSLITTPIELHKNDKAIAYGTGFYYQTTWEGKDHIFLVTNYHVITDNDPHQRDVAPQGDSIIFYLHLDENKPNAVVGLKVPLFTPSGEKIWFEHKNSVVDIAVIPMMFFSSPMTPDWKTIGKNLVETDTDISVTDSVTLIGYPRMFFDNKNALPIYKTGNIASEYDYDFDGDPCFIIDISAFSGNSGSPVFSIRKNAQIISDQILIKAQGSIVKFLGVYSAGIEYEDQLPLVKIKKEQEGIVMNLDMQLGVVWKAHLIEEIIKEASYQSYEKISKELVTDKGFKYKLSQGLNLS